MTSIVNNEYYVSALQVLHDNDNVCELNNSKLTDVARMDSSLISVANISNNVLSSDKLKIFNSDLNNTCCYGCKGQLKRVDGFSSIIQFCPKCESV